MEDKTIYLRVCEMCSQRGITILTLENKLGFGRSTIRKWEKSVPTVVKLKKVADYFGVSVDYFLS